MPNFKVERLCSIVYLGISLHFLVSLIYRYTKIVKYIVFSFWIRMSTFFSLLYPQIRTNVFSWIRSYFKDWLVSHWILFLLKDQCDIISNKTNLNLNKASKRNYVVIAKLVAFEYSKQRFEVRLPPNLLTVKSELNSNFT